jgi:hypothetical protein
LPLKDFLSLNEDGKYFNEKKRLVIVIQFWILALELGNHRNMESEKGSGGVA